MAREETTGDRSGPLWMPLDELIQKSLPFPYRASVGQFLGFPFFGDFSQSVEEVPINHHKIFDDIGRLFTRSGHEIFWAGRRGFGSTLLLLLTSFLSVVGFRILWGDTGALTDDPWRAV